MAFYCDHYDQNNRGSLRRLSGGYRAVAIMPAGFLARRLCAGPSRRPLTTSGCVCRVLGLPEISCASKKISPVNRSLPPFAGHPCGGLGCPPTENPRQFSVSCVLTGSATAREITVVPIKS